MSRWTDKIYTFSPVWIQNIGISLYGYYWNKRRFGGIFDIEYRKFKDREEFNFTQWHDHQEIELRRLLAHAYDNVPYYREQLSKVGLNREAIKNYTLHDLKKLPFLEKSDLRMYGKSKLLSSVRESKGTFYSSSGSTGTPTKILFSEKMHQRWSAGFEARIRNWASLSRYNERGMIGGRRVIKSGDALPPFYRYNYVEKQVYFSAYHITAKNAPDYLNGILNYKLDYMTGYAASNYFLARFFDELGLSVPPLKAVITSSEKLTPQMRSMFAKVYQCKTYDSYSGVEACGLISECEHGGLHISPDIGIVEVLDKYGNNAKPGTLGEVVSTGFLNYDQPLIRYRIGDMVRLAEGTCACGRQMPLVEEIVGRVEDIVIGKDGREVVRFHGIFVDLPNIEKGQIIQEEIDDFVIKIVSSNGLTANERKTIASRMKSQLGEINIIIEEVLEIPTYNGKHKAVISKVNRYGNR